MFMKRKHTVGTLTRSNRIMEHAGHFPFVTVISYMPLSRRIDDRDLGLATVTVERI